MSVEDRIERSRLLYEHFVFDGDATALATAERELDMVEAGLALARGRVMHGRFLAEGDEDPQELSLFERALQLYQMLGDVPGVAESLFWVGIYHQVVRNDNDAAVPVFERSRELAVQVGELRVLSYVLRHLGVAEHAAGRLNEARGWLEESVRLRRQLGFMPGVAANLVGLGYIAAAQGRRDEAVALLDEAGTIAEAHSAPVIARQVEEARTTM